MKTPHINEYLSPREVAGIYKSASGMEEAPPTEPVKEKTDWKQVAKIMGTGALGMGVGTLASFGGLELADRVLGGGGAASSRTGIPVPVMNKLVPIVGAGAGLTYSLWKAREMERMRRAVQPSSDDKPAAQ